MYGSSGRLALLLMGATLSCASAVAQPGTGATIVQLPSAQAIINRDTNPFSGSTPQGTATAETIEISVEDALDRGLKYNLGAYLSNQTSAEARAAQIRSLSNLLPHVSGSFGEELQRINLKAFGFKFAGFPSSVGPFGLTATSASGTWDLLNLSSIDKYRASGETVKAA